MTSISAQGIGYIGAQFHVLSQLRGHLEERGFDMHNVTALVSDSLYAQGVANRVGITGGVQVAQGETSLQSVGVAQNSDLSLTV